MVGDYLNYFRQLAIRHKKLQHDVESETGNAGFEKKKFARWTYWQVLEDSRKMGYPCMMIEMPETYSSATNVQNIKGVHTGAITILEISERENETDQERASVLAEEILYDIIQKVWHDHYGPGADKCTAPLTYLSFDQNNILPVGPLADGEMGWRWEFQFKMQKDREWMGEPANFI